MKKSYNPLSDARNENAELSRRLFRAISDVVRQLDDRRGRVEECTDLFTPWFETQRVKLREYCERIMFLDPVGYGRKGEELLWRKGYYDVYSTIKRLRKNNTWKATEIGCLQSHLLAGAGYYHHLLLRLQTEYKLDLRGIIDFPLVVTDDGLKKGKNTSKPGDGNALEWARQAAHRCLLYLGDLSRYMLDLHPRWNTGLSVRYYSQALNLNYEAGMPYNQLGTLSGNKSHNVDAVYYYMRCLSCPQTFEGAEGNLIRIFEKNSQWLQGSHSLRVHEGIPLSPAEHIHRLLGRFLVLTDVWYFDKTGSVPDLPLFCNQTLEDLQLCLRYQKSLPPENDPNDVDEVVLTPECDFDCDNPEYLHDSVVFKLLAIILMCITKQQVAGFHHVSAVVAFTAAVFSHLLQQVLSHLQDAEVGLALPLPPSPATTTASSSEATSLSAVSEGKHAVDPLVNGAGEAVTSKRRKEKPVPSLLRRRRRRRPRKNSSEDSDVSDGDLPYEASTSSEDECNSEISENEEAVASSSDDEDEDDSESLSCMPAHNVNGLSCGSLQPSCTEDKIQCNGNGLHEAEPEKMANSEVIRNDKDMAEVLEVIEREGLLSTVKVCADWLRGDVEVVRACGRSSRPLLAKVVALLNAVNVDMEQGLIASNVIKLKNLDTLFEKAPLPEDFMLRGLPILQTAHKVLDWNCLQFSSIRYKDQAVLRIRKLVDFGHFLASIPDTGISYDASRRQFDISSEVTAVQRADQPPANTGAGDAPAAERGVKTLVTPASRRGQLMHHMGQLWLREEVRELETRVRRRGASFSPYLALDAEALIYHTPLVKQLVGARRFIVLIPGAVLTALDELKRDEGRAREAIRWLETQLQRGNRFLRAQRTHERLPLPLIKYPKRKDKEAWLFFQVVECCHYFGQQPGVHETASETALVTLLTGVVRDDSVKGYSPVGVAKSAGINLEHIEAFHAKWKTSSKSHG